MNDFVEILEGFISGKKLSLENLSVQCKVSSSQLSEYLRGTMIPSVKNAVKLSNFFNCSIDYLFGLSEDKGKNLGKNYDLSGFIYRYESLLRNNKTTNYKFCKENNLSESMIRLWKRGQNPSISTLYIIASKLCSSIDYLIGRK